MSTTQNTIKIVATLERIGITATGVRVTTLDGRTWMVETTDDGFRLFEIDATGNPEEHDAVDGTWTAGDLADYLRAVGRPRRAGR